MTAAVTEGGRYSYRRPLQKAGGGDVSGHYRKWPLLIQEAVTGSGRCRWPSQEAGGGDDSGRYINNALRQDASAALVPVLRHCIYFNSIV
jgi:hypothetical protein